ncbi:YbhB/YbcL family Raf kinase inhibitor-like protein [Corynebacterium pseudotuberculosis]|uniref:YbhB/YbcL family Raf kinase inhibitor-like protein n=1 Tax=Corynebacterium pseudotuberculosis TaxID=1719 RepID=UPI00351418C6
MSTYIDPRFPGPDPYAPLKDLPVFSLSSTSFKEGEKIPEIHLAEGGLSPQLSWSNLPEGTKSLAITCFDPDAPTASGFWHWAAFNIPVSVSEIAQGAGDETLGGIESAITLKGDSGIRGYYGPNPPAGHGPHRYLFAVHAVDVESLEIPADATPTVLGFNLYFHSLARTVYWGWYENA